MTSPPDAASVEPRRPGLRERKKARTRDAIQQQAMRLFEQNGYADTTVAEIADAAEVSQSTFFRYFPTKEDVALHDSFDPLFIAAFHAQPPELAPVPALRAAIREVVARLPDDEWEREQRRMALTVRVPELRARLLDRMAEMFERLAQVIAEREQRPVDDAVRTLAGALCGISMSTLLTAVERPANEFFVLFDEALGRLEGGLKL